MNWTTPEAFAPSEEVILPSSSEPGLPSNSASGYAVATIVSCPEYEQVYFLKQGVLLI